MSSDATGVVALVGLALVAVNLVIRVAAVVVIPEGRRPSSAMAWLVLIAGLPVIGIALFGVLGRTDVGRQRRTRQAEALRLVRERVEGLAPVEVDSTLPAYVAPALHLNRELGALPAVPSGPVTMYADYDESILAMAEAVAGATERVHVEFYITAWDDTTDPLFSALSAAVERGVVVRMLFDHLGSRRLDGYRDMLQRLTAAGIEWREMLPLRPLRGQVRRPDLRNHRKILVVDGAVAVTGSQNLTEPSYHNPKHRAAGRRWVELTARVEGPLARSLEAVFATDWYTETGELLDLPIVRDTQTTTGAATGAPAGPALGQVVPSGPGVVAENNLRLFTTLVYGATRRLSITSPYFVPDESLLYAVTTAARRGVAVELFVSEEGDQFIVHHAQCSYYRDLLEAGVRIWLYRAPLVLHAKHLTVDDDVAVLGSSNMDLRSFALNYEVSLMLTGADSVASLKQVEDAYRAHARELTLAEWSRRPRRQRWADNAMRLTASLQ